MVTIDRVSSPLRYINKGVVQGSCLGPTLFLIFINDMKNLTLNGSLFLYADDAAVIYSGENDSINCYRMNLDLRTLSSCFQRNLLTMNQDKTKYMHFYHHSVQPSCRITVEVDQCLIERVSSARYLGLELDTHLNSGNHIRMIYARVSPALAALYKLRNVLPSEVLRLIYFSLFHSHLVYLCSILGQTYSSYLRPLQVLQNRALKIVFNLPALTSTTDLYARLVRNVLPIRGIHELQTVRLVRQVMNNEVFHHTDWLS